MNMRTRLISRRPSWRIASTWYSNLPLRDTPPAMRYRILKNIYACRPTRHTFARRLSWRRETKQKQEGWPATANSEFAEIKRCETVGNCIFSVSYLTPPLGYPLRVLPLLPWNFVTTFWVLKARIMAPSGSRSLTINAIVSTQCQTDALTEMLCQYRAGSVPTRDEK